MVHWTFTITDFIIRMYLLTYRYVKKEIFKEFRRWSEIKLWSCISVFQNCNGSSKENGCYFQRWVKKMWFYIIQHTEQLTMTNVFILPPENTKIWIKMSNIWFNVTFHSWRTILIRLCLVTKTTIYITQQQ